MDSVLCYLPRRSSADDAYIYIQNAGSDGNSLPGSSKIVMPDKKLQALQASEQQLESTVRLIGK